MKINKILSLTLVVAAIAAIFSACGKTSNTATSSKPKTTSTINQTIKLGVVGSDKELWIPAQKKLKQEGINLEFVEFSDYVTPNKALSNGDIDLNAFQHQVYLDSEIASNGYKIETIGYTYLSPLNLYSKKIDSVDKLKSGDVVAVPNDATNEGRALKVLEHANIIKLKAAAPFSPTIKDIEKYNIAITIKELAANTITSALPDVTAAIINGNYAADFGLKNNDAIFKDDGTGSEKYWNLIAARSEDLKKADRVKIFKKIIDAFHQPATEEVFNTTFKGAYIKAGWNADLL
ncbi:MAG: MetQ/NlpA family ABC transporter substrate-binding protein, partial [Bacillota bacterium]|nr:MetQ/NlpA family ABC transporter substrate-binding protein [Bacillota bacterium]